MQTLLSVRRGHSAAVYTSGRRSTREKRLRTSEDTRDPPPAKEKQIPTPQPEDVEEGEVYEVGEIVTTTGDVDVVEEDSHFTSASAHVIIGEIMVCNRELQKIKEDINDIEKRLKCFRPNLKNT
ncbi:hypothetical protein AB205_0161400 [Aquarana catesbeiana]|uniref:Uncharacterized protein n=1 Tax=Aquarana catesbeiana TaxID=8400 RepID=A0A2G9RKV9_AQUCT|nr:hypothetical protein AB205_0161400 [Aquarana catesbeiana]